MSIKDDFGKTPTEIAGEIGVSRQAVHDMYRRGVLGEAIRLGHRPSYRSAYRLAYGMTMMEICKLLGLHQREVGRLHRERAGELRDLLETEAIKGIFK